MSKKIYTAFISSAFESLRDERRQVIDSLLDRRVFPIAMEHFTVSSSGNFSDIEKLIDESDFFILLLGKQYGSTDENGISWTEREYDYAVEKKKTIIAIKCDELVENLVKDADTLSEDEKSQIAFAGKITYAKNVSPERDIKSIISNFFETADFSKCIGWTRVADISKDDEALLKWQTENSVFDLAGEWYHVHLNDKDETYIRIGTVSIAQEFTPAKFHELNIQGENYGVLHYNCEKEEFKINAMKHSHFEGGYTLKTNGSILGVFTVKRNFNGLFDQCEVSDGVRRGIHDFTFDIHKEKTTMLTGNFHDEAPSPKFGKIFLFRDIKERDEFILDYRSDVIKQK